MEITYIGHSCFKLKGKDVTVVTDPYEAKIGYKLPKLEADILTISHEHYDHNNRAGVPVRKLTAETPGEYESGGVFIQGYKTYHDDSQGSERGANTVFVIDVDGFTVLHLGDLGHALSKETLEKLPSVDVLLIPVGGKYTIDSETAAKVISSIEPGIVVPMHYHTSDLTGVDGLESLEVFLDEMGLDKPTQEDKLKLTSRADIPEETQVVVLKQAH